MANTPGFDFDVLAAYPLPDVIDAAELDRLAAAYARAEYDYYVCARTSLEAGNGLAHAMDIAEARLHAARKRVGGGS